MSKVYESTVEYNEDFAEYYVTIPEEIIDSLGWEDGDVLEWVVNKDGTVLLTKSDEYFGDSENEED